MTWEDRLREAAYTAPTGERATFTYEDVNMEFDRRTTAYNFPNVDGTFIQDLGRTGRRFPLSVIFHGANYDIEANDFERLVSERGVGTLEHPVYGVFQVMPVGTVRRNDRLKSAANQAVITVTFFETTGVIFPDQQVDIGSVVTQEIEAFIQAAAQTFEDELELESTEQKTSLNSRAAANVAANDLELQPLVAADPELNRDYTNIKDATNKSLLDSVEFPDPATLAAQLSRLSTLPALSRVTSVFTRLRAYRTIAENALSVLINFPNTLFVQDLFALLGVVGAASSAVNEVYEKSPDVLAAAEECLAIFDKVVAWRDERFEEQGVVDVGAMYAHAQSLISITSGFLLQLSFTTAREHRLVLDRDRALLDVVAEVYGTLDKTDFFIESNDLSGNDIISLARGTEIVYYL